MNILDLEDFIIVHCVVYDKESSYSISHYDYSKVSYTFPKMIRISSIDYVRLYADEFYARQNNVYMIKYKDGDMNYIKESPSEIYEMISNKKESMMNNNLDL